MYKSDKFQSGQIYQKIDLSGSVMHNDVNNNINSALGAS